MVVSFVSFLDASTHLYKRVCPSVGWSIGWSVHRSIGPSISNLFFLVGRNKDSKRLMPCVWPWLGNTKYYIFSLYFISHKKRIRRCAYQTYPFWIPRYSPKYPRGMFWCNKFVRTTMRLFYAIFFSIFFLFIDFTWFCNRFCNFYNVVTDVWMDGWTNRWTE